MYGKGFGPEGLDTCTAGDGTETSFVYQVNTSTFAIEKVVAVGAVPKYVAVTPDGRRVLVTNWCSADLSVIDTTSAKEVARIPLRGQHPRGIAVSPDSGTAYIALMGSDRLVRVDLVRVGLRLRPHRRRTPAPRRLPRREAPLRHQQRRRHREQARPGQWQGGEVGADRQGAPLAGDLQRRGRYSVNYESSTVTKLRTSDLSTIDQVPTEHHPIGITYEPTRKAVWVACYGGSILVFDDSRRPVA